jgi:hypothetical protein
MPVAIGIAKSTALYVFLSLPACIWVFGVEFADAKSAAADPTSFADWFLWSGFWALPVLMVTVILSTGFVLFQWCFSKRYRRIFNEDHLPSLVIDNVVGGLSYAFVNPFDAIRLRLKNGLYSPYTGIHGILNKAFKVSWTCWAIALFAYLALGFIAVS